MENTISNTQKQKKIKLDFKDSKYATGRRKIMKMKKMMTDVKNDENILKCIK